VGASRPEENPPKRSILGPQRRRVLTFLDPPKPDAADTLAASPRSVDVKVITGDNDRRRGEGVRAAGPHGSRPYWLPLPAGVLAYLLFRRRYPPPPS
jgi:MYXO-CTERM domain-containing protein